MNRVLRRIMAGQGARTTCNLLVDVANRIEGHTICALGDAAAWPVQSFIKHFRHEFEYMIDHGGRSIVDDPAQEGGMSAAPPVHRPRHPPSDVVNIEVNGKPARARRAR